MVFSINLSLPSGIACLLVHIHLIGMDTFTVLGRIKNTLAVCFIHLLFFTVLKNQQFGKRPLLFSLTHFYRDEQHTDLRICIFQEESL